MKLNRLLTNLCTKDLKQSTAFYTSLFDFRVDYDSEWFVHLISEAGQLELGLIAESHDIVPSAAKGQPAGSYLTFVVDDVDVLFQQAKQLDYTIVEEPTLTFYGQKRLLLLAPEGTVCDLSSPV